AKALSREARIIVMDEPTAPLTQKEIDNLFAVIRELKRQQVAVIYVSHRLAEIKEICDCITVLRDGCYVG
ncbi:D-xylose ABC transporter ATP-binding protein, partial [Extibacter sp. GGCC_0201]|nr:D-xylose ABC transporter ATP-binding protein [Extibacter sp. GGCC_0201]